MSWEPLSRESLDEMIAEGLAMYDEAVRDEWDRVRIEPEKWRCSPWGDPGDGFWVVAITGSQVLWYNDIEEGFNYSRFTKRGVIDEYWCNQTEFVEILERIAQRRSEEAWSCLPLSEVPDPVASPGTVVRRQTTYWDILSADGRRCRIHFRDKEEFRFLEAHYESIRIFAEHPVLQNYSEQVRSIYIAGSAADRTGVLASLDEAVRSATSGWRRLEEYRSPGPVTDELLSGGHGLLMCAPTGICRSVMPVLERAGLRPSAVGGHTLAKGQRALVLGRNFVVAGAFRFDLCE